ncbi:MAG: TetR/AcrR family transcriptional regulator [Gammaproteobacteria bacterium]|nr:TetR/AcrR family transcriptional regulator [Gammaproteobacteria bacterium]
MTTKSEADKLLDAALALGERQGWERLRLADIAVELGLGLDAIRRHYRSKDELVDAWFDRADAAMLQASSAPELKQRASAERIASLLMAWLDALAAHRKLTGEMLLYKLEPAHVHLQVDGLLRISRTVQWLREAASLDAHHGRRILEEITLTSIYLATFIPWLRAAPEQLPKTREALLRRLRQAQAFGCWP